MRDDILYVFYSRAGDCPEHIVCATIDLRPDWSEWKASAPFSILQPETDYEGVSLPLEPSQRGAIHEPARQLRDPGIYQEDGRFYLLYSVAGESGIALAELSFDLIPGTGHLLPSTTFFVGKDPLHKVVQADFKCMSNRSQRPGRADAPPRLDLGEVNRADIG